MTLIERLTTADCLTLERALLHSAAMAAEQSAPLGMRDQTARSILAVALDAGARDWCPPFSLNETGVPDQPVCSFGGRVLADDHDDEEIEHSGDEVASW